MQNYIQYKEAATELLTPYQSYIPYNVYTPTEWTPRRIPYI